MFDIKTIVTALIVSIVVVFGVGLVSDNQPEQLGAVTRMPNVDLIAKTLIASTTSTTATSTVFVTGRSATQGGQVILKDSDGSGCSSLAMNGGATVLSTIACPTF